MYRSTFISFLVRAMPETLSRHNSRPHPTATHRLSTTLQYSQQVLDQVDIDKVRQFGETRQSGW
jgi:hypothetical protein